MNTGVAYCNLGRVYLSTYKPAETREAVAMLTTVRILPRYGDDDDPRLLHSSTGLKQAQAALGRFEEPGVLSAMPCWWQPTSRQEDEAEMARVFATLHRAAGSSSRNLSSEAMEQGLRMHGLFNFTASFSDPVSGRDTGALPQAYQAICSISSTCIYTYVYTCICLYLHVVTYCVYSVCVCTMMCKAMANKI